MSFEGLSEVANILIVDDIYANRYLLKKLLRNDNLCLFEAENGNEALKVLMKENIDMVLLDIQMPDMTGFEVAETMRTNHKTAEIPIVFITASRTDEEFEFKGYESGAVDFIYKPISNKILTSKVQVYAKIQDQIKIIEKKTKVLEMKVNELNELKERFQLLSRIDGLTEIDNRRTFNEEYQQEWKRAQRNGESLAIIMLDIDFFKYYNDTYGHLEGDNCLIKVAKCIKESARRSYDKVARYGGEEFVILLPDTDLKGALHIGKSIRKNIEVLQIEHKTSTVSDYVTVSIGVASLMPKLDTPVNEVLNKADLAMYKAKDLGRNRVESN